MGAQRSPAYTATQPGPRQLKNILMCAAHFGERVLGVSGNAFCAFWGARFGRFWERDLANFGNALWAFVGKCFGRPVEWSSNEKRVRVFGLPCKWATVGRPTFRDSVFR